MPPPWSALVDFTAPMEPTLAQVRERFPKKLTESWTAFDAKCITFSGEYAISSPNMLSIPSYIFGSAKLVARQDGRWGYLDPFQTPQELSSTFLWAPLVPRKDTLHEDDYPMSHYMWRTPQLSETEESNGLRRLRGWFYKCLENLAVGMAGRGEKFCADRGKPSGIVHTLVMGMRRNLLKLRMPRKLRDIRILVADFQRCWLDLYAFLVYELEIQGVRRKNLKDDMSSWDVNENWMGAFTDKESMVLKLWESGIPVWHIRKIADLPHGMKVGKRTLMKWNPDIVTQLDPDDPATPVHTGFGGEARSYLCRPVGWIPLTDGPGILPHETWDEWQQRSKAEAAEAQTLVQTPGQSNASGGSSQRPPSPIVFSSRAPPDVRLLLPEIADKISSLVADQVGKAVSQSMSAREGRSRERIAKPYARSSASTSSVALTTPQQDSWADPISPYLPSLPSGNQ